MRWKASDTPARTGIFQERPPGRELRWGGAEPVLGGPAARETEAGSGQRPDPKGSHAMCQEETLYKGGRLKQGADAVRSAF